ncbi:MAG: helix-turn-helix domain-containing protein [Haloechinothrix sp.]
MRRHAGILALLALHPSGLSAERLALQLYGEAGNPVTVRAEIHRLRAQLGADVVRTKPYRIGAEVDADFVRARSALRHAHVGTLLDELHGPLPDSEAPAICEEREALVATMRALALRSGRIDALWAFWETSSGADDLEVVDRLCALLSAVDPRRTVVLQHRERLLH